MNGDQNHARAAIWYTPDCGHQHLSDDGTIHAVCPDGVPASLDVERLRRAIYATRHHITHINGVAAPDMESEEASAIAREYNRLITEGGTE